MLSCRACLRRCNLAVYTPLTRAHPSGGVGEPFFRTTQPRRLLSSAHDTERTASKNADELSIAVPQSWASSAVAQNQKKWERAALRQQPVNRATPNLDKLGRRDGSVSARDWSNRRRELRHLQDPLDLAVFVKERLSKGRATEMLQLVRMASHSMQCVVSWNHIIDHYLANGQINDALKVYNDMKKRAQFPDSYTYTILLRGLSANAHTSGVLSKALSIYHSLFASNCRVEASIIHTNAALRVCARAMDMDALWGVAAKIPQKGPASANAVTYITIINAIRQHLLLSRTADETEDEAAMKKEQSIIQGRRIWEEVVDKWRRADLRIDEELVCAMGRLLLIGSRPRDWDDVLSLVEQTMDVPRLVPRLGTSERQQAGLPHLRVPNVPAGLRSDDDHLSPNNTTMRGHEFLALVPQGVGDAISNPLLYVRPGNNTLSLVQEACQKTVATKAGEEYWNVLTDPGTYNINPDLNNLNMRLRVLRQNRASSAAVQLLEGHILAQMVVPRPGTFRIAMSTCVRDKNNHNSLRNAGKILQIMLKQCEDADAKTVGMYCELAMNFPLAKGSDLINALTILDPIVKNIRLQLGVGGQRHYGNGVGAVYLTGENRQAAVHVLRRVYALYDRLLFSNMLQEEQKGPFKAARARLSSFLNRIAHKGGGKENVASLQKPDPDERVGVANIHEPKSEA